MLVVENNRTFVNWGPYGTVQPLEYGGDVVISVDPSKTNMAMVFGTPDGTILNTLEFSGNNRRRGPVMDTTVYCEEVRQFLERYLCKAHIYMVGVEATILKKGYEHYHSNQVLNEVRSNLLGFFLEKYGIHVIEVNNWSWKNAVLPEGYRGQHQKGSKLWFERSMPDSPYSHYFEADMTDCICIYWYLVSKHCSNYHMYCNRVEPAISAYEYGYYPDNEVTKGLKDVKYNSAYSLEDNMAYYVNRLGKTFAMTVPVEKLSLEEIYKRTHCFEAEDIFTSKVKVVVCRQC